MEVVGFRAKGVDVHLIGRLYAVHIWTQCK
jgi:hypothetical protein